MKQLSETQLQKNWDMGANAVKNFSKCIMTLKIE